MVSAIILASGYSRRMGKNKLLLKYRGKSLIEHTIDTILKSDFSEVILAAREEKIIEIGKSKDLKVIKNEHADRGISESIKLGVMHAKEANGYMFFMSDQPFLDVSTIKELIDEFKKNRDCIIIPQYKGRRGSPVIFPHSFREEFLKLQGDIGGKVIINNNLDRVRFVEVHDNTKLFDVDTNENYEYILNRDGNKEYD